MPEVKIQEDTLIQCIKTKFSLEKGYDDGNIICNQNEAESLDHEID